MNISIEVICRPKFDAEGFLDQKEDGVFRILTRLPSDVWKITKPWAHYLDQDWLDDNDEFDKEPGWEYRGPAMVALIEAGHTLRIDDIEIANYADFFQVWKKLDEREAEQEAKRRFQAELKRWKSQIAQHFVETGERPEGDNSPEGERVLDTQDIYGGGDWFVIGPQYIWYVKNNGMDGDNWSYNNVRTGGAGAIGWRRPYDESTDEALRALDAGKLPVE